MKALRSLGGGDDRAGGPGAAGAEQGGDVLRLLARRDEVAVDERAAGARPWSGTRSGAARRPEDDLLQQRRRRSRR